MRLLKILFTIIVDLLIMLSVSTIVMKFVLLNHLGQWPALLIGMMAAGATPFYMSRRAKLRGQA